MMEGKTLLEEHFSTELKQPLEIHHVFRPA